jgi:hypothetical protein
MEILSEFSIGSIRLLLDEPNNFNFSSIELLTPEFGGILPFLTMSKELSLAIPINK